MNQLEQIIADNLAVVLVGRPYAEVGDLLHDDSPDSFIKELAADIREFIDDAYDVGHE